ncbi:MAG: nicotinamidase [Verrucomicrobiota bacterium]|nr:nicotinamidase [Verrucomicrobiota bacterium]
MKEKSHAALFITDVQNDFIEGGALPVPHSRELVEKINKLQPRFRHILAVRDWHPPHHVSFASTHGKRVGEKFLGQTLWPDHCIQNEWGSAFAEGLDTSRFEKVFDKGADPHKDSYSAFGNPELAPYLLLHHLDHLYIVGLATDYCILATVLDARALGLKVTLLLDCCRAIDPRQEASALQRMRDAGVDCI